MSRYTVFNRTSGACFGIVDAESIDVALDLIAQDQGYKDYATLCDVVGISVEAGRAELVYIVNDDADRLLEAAQ